MPTVNQDATVNQEHNKRMIGQDSTSCLVVQLTGQFRAASLKSQTAGFRRLAFKNQMQSCPKLSFHTFNSVPSKLEWALCCGASETTSATWAQHATLHELKLRLAKTNHAVYPYLPCPSRGERSQEDICSLHPGCLSWFRTLWPACY